MNALPFELVLAPGAWRFGLRLVEEDPAGLAVGPLRQRHEPGRRLGLVRQLARGRLNEVAAAQPPLAEWFALLRSAEPAPELLRQLAPKPSHRVAVLALGEGGEWDGAYFDRGAVVPLDAVTAVAPGMPSFRRTLENTADDPDADERWSRTVGALGAEVWRKLRGSHVLLVGCGRNGTLAAWQFAGAGVARMTLVDGDLLEPHNLDAAHGLAVAAVGMTKARALAERLIDYRPDLALRLVEQPLPDALEHLHSRPELVVTCVDRESARLAASWYAREVLCAHLDVGSAVRPAANGGREIAADVRLLLPGEGCLQCVGGIEDRDEALYEVAAPAGSLRRGEPIAWHEQRAGSLATINAAAVATGVQCWCDLLAGSLRGSTWQRLDWPPGGPWQCQALPVAAEPACAFCRGEG